MQCATCGAELQVGDWPFCPHGHVGGYANFRDDIPGGVTVENYGSQPITFYSHSERRRYMKEHGLIEKEKFCPLPGTDRDPQGIPNPKGYMDPVTLENARVLLSRAARVVEETVPVQEISGELTEGDVVAVASGNRRRMSRLHRRTDGAH